MRITLNLWQYLLAFLGVVWDTITQKWKSRRLGNASKSCHPEVWKKTCLITGATSGIGLETARELGRKGARVVLAVRNTAAAEQLIDTWRKEQPDIVAGVMQLDLSSLASVREFAQRWDPQKPIHVLINNAGIFSMGGRQKMTGEDLEEHAAVNFLAPSLLTLLLLPALKQAASARVVNVNSQMHELGELDFEDLHFRRRPYSPTAAYCQSKLAQVLFTNALHRRLPPTAGIDVIAVHPGEVVTNVARTLPQWIQWCYRTIMPLLCFMPSHGARASLFCATEPSVSKYSADVRSSQADGGPYYSSNCLPMKVGWQARNKEAADYVWKTTLETLDFPPNYLERLGL